MNNVVKEAIENLRQRKQTLDISIFSSIHGEMISGIYDIILLEDAEEALQNLEVAIFNENDKQNKRTKWTESSNQSDLPKQEL